MQAVEKKARKKEAPSGIDVPWISNYLVPRKGERGWEEKRSRGDTRIATEFRHRIAVKSQCNSRCRSVTNRCALVGVFALLRRSRRAISVARHSSVAIKQGEIYGGGRKLAFSTSKRFSNGT